MGKKSKRKKKKNNSPKTQPNEAKDRSNIDKKKKDEPEVAENRDDELLDNSNEPSYSGFTQVVSRKTKRRNKTQNFNFGKNFDSILAKGNDEITTEESEQKKDTPENWDDECSDISFGPSYASDFIQKGKEGTGDKRPFSNELPTAIYSQADDEQQNQTSEVTAASPGDQNAKTSRELTQNDSGRNGTEDIDIVLTGVLFQLKRLMHSAKQMRIGSVVQELCRLNVNSLNWTAIEKCVKWIVQQVLLDPREHIQLLFLSATLGYLAIVKGTPRLPLPKDETTKHAFDNLLENLVKCARYNFRVPDNCMELLAGSSYTLVQGCSIPGWLTYAAYFYPFFGMRYVFDANVPSCEYSKEDFFTLFSLLVKYVPSIRKAYPDEKGLYKLFLKRILRSVPDEEELFKLFLKEDVRRFFSSQREREEFFIEFYKDTFLRRDGKGRNIVDLRENLKRLANIPQNFRSKIPALIYGYLVEFINSVDEPTSDDWEAVFHLISENLPQDRVLMLLRYLSQSKLTSHHALLLQLLNDARFTQWKNVSPGEKVKICNSWVEIKAQSCSESNGKIGVTFDAVDILISCALISSNAKLIDDLCENAMNLLQKSEDSIRIIEAFKEIENYSEVVQSFFQNVVEDILRRNQNLLKKEEVLNLCRDSKSQRRFLCCILNILSVPEKLSEHNRENAFLKMLEFCDIWVHLVNAKENLGKHDLFITGARIWQNFEDCIMNEEISVSFLHHVEKQKDKLSLIFAGLHNSNFNGNDQENWRSACLAKVTKLVRMEKDVRDKLSLLETAVGFAGKVLSTSSGVIPKEINFMKKNLCTMKIKELNESFWGPHIPLLECLSSLQLLMQSISFENIAKAYLEDSEYQNQNFVAYQNDKHGIGKLFPLFKALETEGISRFEAKWNRVLVFPHLLTVEGTKHLLGELRDEKKLETEMQILQNYFHKQVPLMQFPLEVKIYIKDCMKYGLVLDQAKHIVDLLETFDILDPARSDLVSTLTSFTKKFKYNEEISIATLHEPLTKVEEKISQYNVDESDDVFLELGQSHELVSFLEEILDEDIRVLIDAVEEYSDQSVSESVVSDLIQIHGFITPLIKICQRGAQPELMLMRLVNECKKHPNMAMKIRQCKLNVHSLKGLYQNVANREEMTREIISNCLSRGAFDISLDDVGICKITMSYEKDQGNGLTEKSMPELHDLRSRAHLIINSDKKALPELGMKQSQDIHFTEFIDQVNFLSEIEEAIEKLQSSGYIKYRHARQWPTTKGTNHLQELKNTLFEELDSWEQTLHDARKDYYFLNYFWSDQLYVLYNFLTNPDRSRVDFEDVLTLIRFVDPTIDEDYLHEYENRRVIFNVKGTQDTPQEIISLIGRALEEIFKNTRPVLRSIVDDGMESFSEPLECSASVRKGELYVVDLEERSAFTINVMLSLYENTTNGYPEPYQVIFCSSDTSWEEIELFLQRCFTQTSHLPRDRLFCLANVELLTNEIQFELVDYIKKQDGELDYQLAIICRGGDHHNIVEEFSKYRHHISGMTYPEISQRLQTTWPEVKFVTSTLPGLGKTEFIRQEVLEEGMNVVTFPISGQLDQRKIIHRLKQLHLKPFQCLHFDVGEVDDPVLLDFFLFQLIVTGMVSCGTQLYSLHNTQVYIEVANSLNDQLREKLVITGCFTSVELQWKDYDNLQVSSKITSDIQVVCQYLDAFDRSRLETTDIHFYDQQKMKALPASRCRELLRKYYSTKEEPTFTALNTFLGLLAGQLRKFSKSAFFEIVNLKHMLEDKAPGVRNNLLKALLDVSKDFAARALATCSSTSLQQATSLGMPTPQSYTSTGTSAQHMVARVDGMIKWEESNHLLIVFHAGVHSQSIAAFYRDKNLVPSNVSDLLKSQMVNKTVKVLDDFNNMSHEELQDKLEKIARIKPRTQDRHEFAGYALTPDNMLKMILIILRVRANVPIIIMGETGCGKTSLAEYLANTCQIPFSTYNFHAGRTEDEVKEFIEKEDNEARKTTEQRWVFLDEINTCHHLGLINEIMCHHTLYGRPLSKKLILLAACNPYKLRSKEMATTAGLDGKNKTDEYSDLVYRVHPLPEAMIDYVWDYGSLTPKDEKEYIKRMVQKIPRECQDVLVHLLAESQRFIRESEKNPFCVSLRDVRRCIVLIEWFMDMIKNRVAVKKSEDSPTLLEHLEKYRQLAQEYDNLPVVKSIILALAHCYLSRLETDERRKDYKKCMAQVFSTICTNDLSEDAFSAIIRMEQEDYLSRMELPPGTAKNAALRENVFVMLVSILNRIPVFVVGKPGCSKSLSIQLIRSNLRGKDSKDHFFRTLPQLYVVSYQGSESSTSEGINKIFEIALKYKDHNKDANVLPVVLLDEVGLAENSPNNPLKVLHSILEPGKGKLPQVAVVGISNWALDAAKMNRAIHLSRPEPTVEDLRETAISLYHASKDSSVGAHNTSNHNVLDCLANAYHEYQHKQGHANFHGLRDYYSLVKSLDTDNCNDMHQISVALQRNFGGIPVQSSKVQKIFIEKLKSHVPTSSDNDIIPVSTLVLENLADLKARHLMLITNGDSAIGILKQNLSQSTKETVTIFGSRFEEDMSDDYNYRMLSRIILCMERECVLILRDLESIYGSLYDMLNQNYAVVGKRKNCRVALGAYSNPMCYVNDGFRCIVLVDEDKVDYSDPPFLNRFEKQLFRFSDVLNKRELEIIEELQSWVRQMSSVEGFDEQFKESDMFMGYHNDTLSSLVLLHSNDTDEENEVIVRKCKEDLMWIATPDGVLRTQRCERSKEDSRELKMLTEEYFEKPIHNGLNSFMAYVVNDQEFTSSAGSDVGSKTIVMTYASVHTDLNTCLDDPTETYQLERLGAYKSEKQLEDRVHHFFFSCDKEFLILQCKPELDGEHMLLARSIVEGKRNLYEKKHEESNSRKKHVCILVHVQRAVKESTMRWQFNFLSGWKQVFLDMLRVPSIALNEMRTESLDHLLSSSVWSFQRFAQECIVLCFNCIKYTQNPRPLLSILNISKNLLASEQVRKAIQKLVLRHISRIDEEDKEPWLVKVACDIELLFNSSTLSFAMEHYLSCLIRQPLAKIVYVLEKENAWPPHLFSSDKEEDIVMEYEDLWCEFLMNGSIVNLSEIPECRGTETYSVSGARLDLNVPFSQVIFNKARAARNLVLKEYNQGMENETNFDEKGGLTDIARLEQLQRYSQILGNVIPCVRYLPTSSMSSYTADLLEITSADFNSIITSEQCISFSMCAFLSFAKEWLPIKDPLQFCAVLHLFLWRERRQLIDLLRLVHWCQEFVKQNRLDNLTKKFYSANNRLLPFSENTVDERFEVMQRRRKSLESKSSENSDPEDSGSDSTDDESSNSDSSDDDSSNSDSSEDDSSDSESSDGEDESIAFDGEADEEQDCFEDIFVTYLCEEMFPSKQTVVNSGGLESWIRNSSLLLSLAVNVSNKTPAFHFLRLCVDYATLFVVQSDVVPRSYLYLLYEISKDLKPDYLDAEGSFQTIWKKVIEPVQSQLRGHEENYSIFETFLAKFYSRCLETNVDSEASPFIVQDVFSQSKGVLTMTPVIYRLLYAEQHESPGVFFDIVINQKIDEKHSCLKEIDDVFKARYKEGSIHHDSYPAVMICDLIYSIQNFEASFSMEDLASSDSLLLRCFRSATNAVIGSEHCISLVLLSSVAFLRAFYAMLSKRPNLLTSETSYSHVIGEINSLLAGGGARRSSIQIFLLKQLYETGMTIFDLQKLCHESAQLPVIKNQFDQSEIVSKVELASMYNLPEYVTVKAAYLKLTQWQDDDMLTVLRKCQDSSNHCLALLAFLINVFYVKKAVGNLSDKEERLAAWLERKSQHLTCPVKELLLRIIGRKDFNHQGLQISLESSTDKIETALLILHVSCVVACRVDGKTSPLCTYLSDPERCFGTWILAYGHEDRRGVFDQPILSNEHPPVTCSCGLRIKFERDLGKNACPKCKTVMENADSEENLSNPIKIYCLKAKSKNWEECTDNMDASVFRALHLIVHACLYAGIALEISSNEAVSLLLGSTPGVTPDDSADVCFSRIKDDLNYLKTILSCKRNTAVDVMHLVIKECTDLIRGKIPSKDVFSTRQECLEWENKFANIAQEILPRALGSARFLKELKMQFESEEHDTLIENQIQELDEYPSDPAQQNEELKRLFRVTTEPTFTELRSILLNSSKDFQQQHIVLTKLLSKYDELPYIASLSPLLKWTRLVSSALTHRISRQEAQSKFNINDFIEGHLQEQTRSSEERGDLRKLFNDFREAWNKMREFVNQNLEKDVDEMPYLAEGKYIGYCLIEGDFGIYLRTAISILQTIQNSVLDEMLLTSTYTRHPALSFLEKNEKCTAIPSLSLLEAKEKDIISVDWSDQFLRYAQNPEYGHGEEIEYDFELTEMELAKIVLGKCYLMESPKTFVFSKELFHASAQTLTKIRELYPQSQSLPDEVRQGLCRLKERRHKDAQSLLQHIEVVIFVLNMNTITSVEGQGTSVEKFVETWESKLPSPFPVDLLPEPRASIKLTHIAVLYEALEDLLADGTIEGLATQYREKLTEEMKRSLDRLVDSRNGLIKLQQFLTALRRFVFRYLSAEKFLPEAHTPLRSCLQEPSLWSPDEAPSADVIPGEMTLANIHAIITTLEREKTGYSSVRNPNQRRNQPGPRKKGGRRVIANFSR